MAHETPPALKKPGRARKALAVIIGLMVITAIGTFVLAMGHQETKPPAPERGNGVSPLEAAVPGKSKPGSAG